MTGEAWVIAAVVGPYLATVIGATLLNAADIYFLQTDRLPPLHRSPSFWLYLAGHAVIALFASWLLYAKAEMSPSDWPLVSVISAFTGFSVVQSFTLKLGSHGVDARELFDQWKRRVLEDVIKVNVSNTRVRQSRTANRLAKEVDLETLRASVTFLAADVQTDPQPVLDRAEASGVPALTLAQWIVSADLGYGESLLDRGGDGIGAP
jgi:hypothetical protein